MTSDVCLRLHERLSKQSCLISKVNTSDEPNQLLEASKVAKIKMLYSQSYLPKTVISDGEGFFMRKKGYSEKEKDAVVAFYRSGMWITEIARTVKTSQDGIAAILDERGVNRPKVVRVTPERASEVAELCLETGSLPKVEESTGLSRPTIYKILKLKGIPVQSQIISLKKKKAVELYLSSDLSAGEICKQLGLSKTSLYRELKKQGEQ